MKIADLIIFEDWLSNQPVQVIDVVANRVALRMLPFWREFQDVDGSNEIEKTIPIWRLVFTDWVCSLLDERNPKFVVAKSGAIQFYSGSAPKTSYSKFLSAKGHQEKAHELSKFVESLVRNASQIVSSDDPAEKLWDAISFDANAFDAGKRKKFVSETPLWPKHPPHWAAEAWEKFQSELGSEEHWRVWSSWYKGRLLGRAYDFEVETKKALLPDVVWFKGAREVNESLLRTEEIRTEKLEAEKDQYTIFSLLETKEIRAALADFEFDQLAKLMRMVPFVEDHKLPEEPMAQRAREDKLSEISEAFTDFLEDLSDSNQNIPADLKKTIRRYASESARPIDRVRPGRLWDLGGMLRAGVLDEDIQSVLSPMLHKGLEQAVDKHFDLMRDFFAATIARQRNIDGITPVDENAPDAVLRAIESSVAEFDRKDWGGLPSPDVEIYSILKEEAEELDGLLLSANITGSEQVRENRLHAYWRKAKTTVVTILRYAISVYREVGQAVGTSAGFYALFPSQFAGAVDLLLSLFKNIPWIMK